MKLSRVQLFLANVLGIIVDKKEGAHGEEYSSLPLVQCFPSPSEIKCLQKGRDLVQSSRSTLARRQKRIDLRHHIELVQGSVDSAEQKPSRGLLWLAYSLSVRHGLVFAALDRASSSIALNVLK